MSYVQLCMSNPHFLRDGGVLGFSCEHDYVFQDLNCTEDLPCLLKGSDNIVYQAAKSLSLPVIVKHVTNHLDPKEKPYRYVSPKFEKFVVNEPGGAVDEEWDEDCLIESLYGMLVHYDKRIMWCQKLTKLQPAFSYIVFGNEATCLAVYEAAAILVCVPKWGKCQALGNKPQHYHLEETAKPSKKKSKTEEEEEDEEWEREAEEARAAVFGGADMNDLLRCDSDDST